MTSWWSRCPKVRLLIIHDEGERLGRTSFCTRCSRDSTRCIISLRLARTDLTCSTWLPRLFLRNRAFLRGIDIALAAMDGN